MINPVTININVPKTFERSLKALSKKTTIHQGTLARLAIYEFLVKHNAFEGESEERDSYSRILGHFTREREKRFELPKI